MTEAPWVGIPFLHAGSNVTLTAPDTQGDATIASGGSAGTPGGSTGQFQYNAGAGALGGASELTFATGIVTVTGTLNVTSSYQINGVSGVSGTFTTVDSKTVTVTHGLITSITT